MSEPTPADISALMAKWGRKGGQSTSEKKRASSRRNLGITEPKPAQETAPKVVTLFVPGKQRQ